MVGFSDFCFLSSQSTHISQTNKRRWGSKHLLKAHISHSKQSVGSLRPIHP
ncbi:hypothetical protein V6Z11_D07G200700 [Gossypium hirsutum]